MKNTFFNLFFNHLLIIFVTQNEPNVDDFLCQFGETWLDFVMKTDGQPGWFKQTILGFANRIMPGTAQKLNLLPRCRALIFTSNGHSFWNCLQKFVITIFVEIIIRIWTQLLLTSVSRLFRIMVNSCHLLIYKDVNH